MSEEAQDEQLNKDRKFGSNSYHYWHNHGKVRAELGDVAPPPKHELVEIAEKQLEKPCKAITKYSFSDGDKKVQVYIDWPGIGSKPDSVSCVFDKRSFDLKIAEEGECHRLCIPQLRSAIFPDTSTFRLKENQIVVSLMKAEKGKWYDLKN
eukprot:EG_transcript_37646